MTHNEELNGTCRRQLILEQLVVPDADRRTGDAVDRQQGGCGAGEGSPRCERTAAVSPAVVSPSPPSPPSPAAAAANIADSLTAEDSQRRQQRPPAQRLLSAPINVEWLIMSSQAGLLSSRISPRLLRRYGHDPLAAGHSGVVFLFDADFFF